MKKFMMLQIVLFLFTVNYTSAQVSRFVKNVKSSVTNELLGNKQSNSSAPRKTMPEPSCACEPAGLILDLGGKFKLDYTELNLTVNSEGSLVVEDRVTGNFYTVKDGVTKGPYAKDNPAVTGKERIAEDNEDKNPLLVLYKDYISKSGDKLLITFMGKKYGPYALINNFVLNTSKDKFAAQVTENVVITEDEGKKMDERMKKAKTNEEKMALGMEMSQKMQANMMKSGGVGMSPTIVSNIPGTSEDVLTVLGGKLNSKVKYDEIVLVGSDKIMDITGKTLIKLPPGTYVSNEFFLKSDNSKYATYLNGTLTFSDKTTLSELFNPYIMKSEGKVYLSYMYYSPKRNSIMQCKVAF
jgi:hypothetical protein